jgi:hypothetical protein
MRKLIVIEFVTLDGVMQGLGSPDEDRDGDFELGGWGAPYGDEIQQAAAPQWLRTTSAYLFVRRTYDKMLALDLVDCYRLFLHPLLLGTGKRLFRGMDHPRRLRVSGAEPTSTGVVMLSYDTA